MKRSGILERILRSAAANLLSDDTKMELSKFQFSLRFLNRVDKDKSLLPFLSFLQDGDAFSVNFCKNYLEHFGEYRSQIGQDCFVDTYFNGKTGGCFMEIGVGNGYHQSNSYYFEKYKGWEGVLCEPSRGFRERLQRQRSAILVPLAIHPSSNQIVDFIEQEGGNFQSTIRPGQLPADSVRAVYPVQTITFNDLADTYLSGKTIDYLSLDIEGNETAIIRTIDFIRFDIRVISIEHNKDPRVMQELIEYLEPLGYKYYDNRYFDWDIIFYK